MHSEVLARRQLLVLLLSETINSALKQLSCSLTIVENRLQSDCYHLQRSEGFSNNDANLLDYTFTISELSSFRLYAFRWVKAHDCSNYFAVGATSRVRVRADDSYYFG